MKKVNRDPFSNGTEFDYWNERNCERCIKASRFKRETIAGEEYTNCNCAIQRDIITRLMDKSEPISQRTIDVCNMTDCPYRKEHYPTRKRKPKKVEGINDLFD